MKAVFKAAFGSCRHSLDEVGQGCGKSLNGREGSLEVQDEAAIVYATEL